MDNLKVWYTSKVFWGMVALFVLSVLQIVQEWYAKGDFSVPGILGLAISIIVAVIRIWFTDTAINTPKARAKVLTDERLAECYDNELPPQ